MTKREERKFVIRSRKTWFERFIFYEFLQYARHLYVYKNIITYSIIGVKHKKHAYSKYKQYKRLLKFYCGSIERAERIHNNYKTRWRTLK